MNPVLLAALAARLGPQARICGGSPRSPFSHDRAELEFRTPRAIMSSPVEADCVAAIRFATRRKIDFALRGAGQSCNGLSLSDGLVIHMPSSGCGDMTIDGDVASIHAGMIWRDVCSDHAMPRLDVPVLTANLGATVGGTLANGGFGARSIRHGCQMDHVAWVRLVRPSGHVETLTASDPLFSGALGAQGQAGLVTRVGMTLRRRPAATRVMRKIWRDTDEMLDDLAFIDGTPEERRPDILFSFIDRRQLTGQPRYGVFGSDRHEGSARSIDFPAGSTEGGEIVDFDLSLDRDAMQWVADLKGHRLLLADFVFDHAGFRRFARAWLKEDPPAWLNACYVLAASPPPARRPRFLFDPRQSDGLSFGMGLYFAVPYDTDPAEALRSLASATALCRECGGRSLLYGANRYLENFEDDAYREALERLRQIAGKDGLLQ